MLHEVEQNTDWESRYQDALKDLEAREQQWVQCETLLRMAISRLSIAGRGLDAGLDKQLRTIQELSRDKHDDELAAALPQLAKIVASLGNPKAGAKSRRSDPVMLMLELLQNIHFNAAQRGQLKDICSELLISVANGHDRDSVSAYIQKLSVLINENFGSNNIKGTSSSSILPLLQLLDLDESTLEKARALTGDTGEVREQELNALASLINTQINSNSTGAQSDQMMTTLLEKLALIQGADSATQEIQTRVHEGVDDEQWTDTLNDIVNSISSSLKNLEQEKRGLENFIVKVTEQLGDVTQAINEDQKDQESNYEDAKSLQGFVQEGIELIQKNSRSSNDLQELKSEISKNIDDISGGVDDFAERFDERHEATAERNLKLTEQLSQMEQETQELQVMLQENRTKLLYDALTGVYSRMAYDERIQQELARWTRYQTPFSYVILDIDHFKRINDTYGHNAGDKALKLVAQLMTTYVRQSDYVFRIGGEEFVLLLTSTAQDNASKLVEKMRAGIAASSFHFKGEPVTLTLSAGITETRDGDDVESIYERADKALYKAKNSGRDCQFIAD
ncbi:MAG: diguanylate cyclase [Gammaproteobacteria bacterium]|nr:diguanylate cyclase [Gammaproteobacteria bacterium]MDH3856362.1 diguanylate cyclase [Gammaproteobacteria bacterium]